MTLAVWKSLVNTSEAKKVGYQNGQGDRPDHTTQQSSTTAEAIRNQRSIASLKILRSTLAANGFGQEHIRQVVNKHLTTCDEYLLESYPQVYYQAMDSGQLPSLHAHR